MTTELETPELDTVALAIVSPTSLDTTTKEQVKALIEAKRADYAAITIAGADDREGMSLAKLARRALRTTRVQINTLREDLNEDHLTAQRANNAAAKELIALIESIEDPIVQRIKEVEKEIADEKIRAAEAKTAKINARIMELINLGGVYAAGVYTVAGVDVEALEVQSANDEDWQGIMGIVNDAYNEKLLADQEAERVRVEEAERLNQQKLEQEAQQKVLDEQAAELKAGILSMRIEVLTGEGFALNERGAWQLAGFGGYSPGIISNLSAADFTTLLASLRQWKAEAGLLTTRRQAFVDLGWQSDGRGGVVGVIGEQRMGFTRDELVGMSEVELTGNIQVVTDLVALLKEQEATAEKQRMADEKAAKKADKERVARLKADKVLLKKWATKLGNFPGVVGLEQPETRELLTRLIGRLSLLAGDMGTEIDAL